MNKFASRIVMALTVGLMTVASASAAIEWRQDAVSTVPGTVTNDLYVTAAGDIATVEMLMSAPGGIYQDANGSNLPPNAAFFAVFPSLEFDSYLGLGSTTSGGPAGEPQVAGGAVDIGGAPGATFDENLVDIAWFPSGGSTLPGDAPQFVARITLMDTVGGDDAMIFVQSSDGTTESMPFQVMGGVIGVPEPSGLALLCLGLVTFLRRRS